MWGNEKSLCSGEVGEVHDNLQNTYHKTTTLYFSSILGFTPKLLFNANSERALKYAAKTTVQGLFLAFFMGQWKETNSFH